MSDAAVLKNQLFIICILVHIYGFIISEERIIYGALI